MKIRRLFAALASALLLALPAAASASTYNGTTINPEADGQTYVVVANAGDTVTLASACQGTSTISVKFTNNVNGTIKIVKTTTLPSDASSAPSGNIDHYCDVTLTGFSDSDLASAVWSFTVAKSFLSNLGLSASNVSLKHYVNSSWTTLSTQETSSDSTNYTFSSTTSGFSPFAVVADPGLSNTGFPYAVSAVAGVSVLAVVGATFMLTRQKRAN